MIKRLIVICITIISSYAYGQAGSASPYSFYGIGTLKFKGTAENRSMGGIGVYLDSIHINLRNPAAYAGNSLKSRNFGGNSRPVKFAVAGASTNVNLKSDSGEGQANSGTFDYLALSIPLGKFGFGFGLVPYTAVGYELEDIEGDDVVVNRFFGEGGVNRVFFGLGYSLSDKLTMGLDFNYNFGNIQNSAIEIAYTPEGDVVQFQTREFSRSDLRGVNLNFGLAYKTMITDKLELSATAAYSPESNLSSENTRSFSTVTLDATTLDITSTRNTIDADLEAENLDETDLTLPSRLSFGAGIGQPRSWFVGAEYTMQNTSNFSNPLYSNDITSFENASQFSAGGFYIPKYNAFSGYFKRVVYRAGFNFGNTGLVIKDEEIKEFGISFGLGLPVGEQSLFSNANVGFEFGQRGTTDANLVQENFINFNLSLSLNARWFAQRKYD